MRPSLCEKGNPSRERKLLQRESFFQVLSSYNLLGSNKMEQAYFCGGVNNSAIAPIYGDNDTDHSRLKYFYNFSEPWSPGGVGGHRWWSEVQWRSLDNRGGWQEQHRQSRGSYQHERKRIQTEFFSNTLLTFVTFNVESINHNGWDFLYFYFPGFLYTYGYIESNKVCLKVRGAVALDRFSHQCSSRSLSLIYNTDSWVAKNINISFWSIGSSLEM